MLHKLIIYINDNNFQYIIQYVTFSERTLKLKFIVIFVLSQIIFLAQQVIFNRRWKSIHYNGITESFNGHVFWTNSKAISLHSLRLENHRFVAREQVLSSHMHLVIFRLSCSLQKFLHMTQNETVICHKKTVWTDK